MVDALRSQVRTLTFGANIKPFAAYDPMRPLLQWHNSYRMNSHLSQELDHRFKISQTGEKRLTKSIIDLALETYTAEKPRDELDGMDATFKKFAMSQVKLFLFSGHDTTSSSICYVFYLLSTHQSALDSVRREHDAVFGSPLEQRKEKLEQEPFLINQLPFTLAVIKESLRLFPPLSSPRAGEPGFHVKDTDGHSFPTEGFLIWSISQAMHRDPEFWPQPDTFLPERWLVAAGDTLAPAKGAWRPFEYGPRNCIGQELAIIEMKIVLVMALQAFDFEAAYEELDRLAPIASRSTVNGERAYQVQLAQPSGDFPCRVKPARK